MMLTCEFCKNTFTTSSNLYYHQRHTKSCLEIQGRVPPVKPICQYCGETVSNASRHRLHEEKCDKRPSPIEEKMAIEMNHLRLQLAERDQELEKIREDNVRLQEANIKNEALIEEFRKRMDRTDELLSKRSKITHKTTNIFNGNVTQHLDLSNTDRIHAKLSQHLDQNTMNQGQVGIARLVVKEILTTDDNQLLYVCTDQDRHIFRYLNADGEEVKDIRAGHLKEALDKSGIRQIAFEKAERLYTNEDGTPDHENMKFYHSRATEIAMVNLVDEDHKFRNELARLTSV